MYFLFYVKLFYYLFLDNKVLKKTIILTIYNNIQNFYLSEFVIYTPRGVFTFFNLFNYKIEKNII